MAYSIQAPGPHRPGYRLAGSPVSCRQLEADAGTITLLFVLKNVLISHAPCEPRELQNMPSLLPEPGFGFVRFRFAQQFSLLVFLCCHLVIVICFASTSQVTGEEDHFLGQSSDQLRSSLK